MARYTGAMAILGSITRVDAVLRRLAQSDAPLRCLLCLPGLWQVRFPTNRPRDQLAAAVFKYRLTVLSRGVAVLVALVIVRIWCRLQFPCDHPVLLGGALPALAAVAVAGAVAVVAAAQKPSTKLQLRAFLGPGAGTETPKQQLLQWHTRRARDVAAKR